MLFNPKWLDRYYTDLDPLGLDTLIAWLEKQPREEWYDYRSCHSCLLAQYFGEHWGSAEVSKNFVNSCGSGLFAVQQSALLPEFFNWIAEDTPHRFDSALERAKLARDNTKEARARVFKLSCYNW